MQAALYKLDFGETSLSIRFVRNRKARRYVLRLDHGGVARVTIPRGGSLEAGLRFAERNKTWIQKQVASTQREWTPGMMILVRGVPRELQTANGSICVGEFEIPVSNGTGLRQSVEGFLRAVAERELKPRTLEMAQMLGLTARAVRVGNQRTRWGSCSMKGTICLNWRLIQTPEFVRDYIIVHELMHLREMNHSVRFWKHVETVLPNYREAERWLRKNAALLR